MPVRMPSKTGASKHAVPSVYVEASRENPISGQLTYIVSAALTTLRVAATLESAHGTRVE
jgi:hypothetical protein